MVKNHGDGKSPKDRVVGPLPNGLNGGDPNYLLSGMILQVPPFKTNISPGCLEEDISRNVQEKNGLLTTGTLVHF